MAARALFDQFVSLFNSNASNEFLSGALPVVKRREFEAAVRAAAKPLRTYSSKEFSNRERAENRMFEIVAADSEIAEILDRELGAPLPTIDLSFRKSVLKSFYTQLIWAGAGQWVLSHWVPAFAIATPETLRYIAKRLPIATPSITRDEPSDALRMTAFEILEHFERAKPLNQ